MLAQSRPARGLSQTNAPGHLAGAISRGGYFALAFGSIVGSGWVVVLGDWLGAAAPGGTVVGFVVGGFTMVLISLCYGELAARFPAAGAEFLYTLETFGPRTGFLVAWFLTLYAIAGCAFEAIACSLFLRELIPSIDIGAAYSIGGSPVGWDSLWIGGVGCLAVGTLHYRGARSAIFFQNVVTFGFIGVSLALMVAGVARGSVSNLEPIWVPASHQSWPSGALWIFSTCAFFMNGWQTALHAIEERKPNVSPRTVVMCVAVAILASVVFYVGIVMATASATPWPALVTRSLPAAEAFRAVGWHGILGPIVLVAATISMAKTWSAIVWMGSRLVFAQARLGFLPAVLAQVDERTGAPRAAVVFVVALNAIGLALGRKAILPIIDMTSLCLALTIILCIVVLLRCRRRDAELPGFTVPGGLPIIVTTLAGAIAMVGVALVQPIIHGHGGVPVEWIAVGAWAILGLAVSTITVGNRRMKLARQS